MVFMGTYYIRRPRPSPRPGRRLGPPQVWNLSCRTTLQNPPNPPKPSKPSKHSPKPSKPSKHLPQQAPQGQGHFPNRHPRAKATAMAFYGLSKLPFARLQTLQTFQNLPNPPNPPKPSKPSKHLPQQAPQGQGHFSIRHPRANWLSKLPFASPQTLQTLQNPPNPPKPSKTLQTPSKISKPSKTLQTLQTPSPTGTPGPRPLLKQAPQGQGHSNGFLLAFKAAVCQPANTPNAPKPSKPFKTLQTLQTPSKTLQTLQNPPNPPNTLQNSQTLQNPPNPPNTLLSRHPRAKATSPTGTPGPRPQHSFLWAFKGTVCQPANTPNAPKPSKPSKTLQTLQTPSKPSKHLPQQAPQGQGHFSNKHPRAKATAMAFYWLSKLPFASPQTLQTLQNPPKPSKTLQTPSKTLQTLQNPPKPSKHPPNTLQTLPNPPKPSKHLPQQAPQGQGHFPNKHPRAKATSQTGTPGPRPQQ